MLPYAPLHHLLFVLGAPDVLVLTSANRSSEPIAFDDADAAQGWRGSRTRFSSASARSRVASTTRSRASPRSARRSCAARAGMAPQAVALLPATEPILAVGADLKNAVALVVDGQVFVSQHVGDLDHLPPAQRSRKPSATSARRTG